MKDYQKTKILYNEISDTCENIDSRIAWLKGTLKEKEDELLKDDLLDHERTWVCEEIEDIKEKISALEWCINRLTTPFNPKK